MAQAPTPPVARKSAQQIVTDWADTLRSTNAPKPHEKGPLGWVRETKVPELLELLKKGGF